MNLTGIKSKLFIQFSLLLVAMAVFVPGNAQQIAFPGAEGYGKYATGGRGTVAVPTTVFEVTNLNDDNNPGSLRYAITNGGTTLARTVVFRVSGTIHLNTQLTIRNNTTIAGQTAPGGGICIADRPVVISGDNVIIRHVRFRMGDRYQNLGMVDGSGGDDVLGNLGGKKIIIDHCSISWSSDEALTIYRGDSITLQWNIVSEPLNYSYHFETGGTDYQEHGYGGIWGSKNGSFHHNLIMHVKGRAPRFAGNSTYPVGVIEKNDFRNNVVYNWISYSTNGGEGGHYNMVNNYYKYGPSTETGNTSGVPKRGMIMNPSKSTDLPYPLIYLSGNYVDGYPDITAANWKGMAMAGGTLADTTLSKVTTAWDAESMPTQSAEEAFNLVMQKAGAVLPLRDTLDERLVNNVINRTGRVIDVQGGYPHGTAYSQTVNAWPSLAAGTAPIDTDHDGMPDAWETANGLNPNDATDRGTIAANGYTNLENYLNSLIDTPIINASGALSPFFQNISIPSAEQQYNLSGLNISNNITVTPPAGFQVSGDNGVTWNDNANPLTISQSGNVVSSRAIRVRLNTSSAGNYSGNILHQSTGAANVNIAVSGTAQISPAPPGTAAIVAQDGTGNYSSVQAAINAAPTNLTTPYIIYIKNGRYREKITIPSNKPFIHLIGESVSNVVLYYNDGASDPLPGGGTVGTQNSASFTVNANDFAAFNITFANTWGDGTQAVAVLVNADRAIFKNCRMLGNQDTLYIKGSGTVRHYFKNCYIDGNVDFIFGSSVAVFDSTVVYAKSRTAAGASYITAANTPAGQTYGYVFRDCIIPNNTGATSYSLGRPWQNSTGSSPFANNKVVFLNTIMSNTVAPTGWSVWDAGTNTSLIYYGEYQSKYFNGNSVDISQRVPWSFQLNSTEAATYTNTNMFGSWNPCAVSATVCSSQPRDIAVSNFRATRTSSNTTIDWNISWAMNQIKYELYRSANRNSGYTKINEVNAVSDTLYNFQLTDALPAAGTSYYYYVVASKSGLSSHYTDTLEISSVPTINISGTIQAFTQNLGTPSTGQTATVSGVNLTGDIQLTPPVNFEISRDGGTTWISNPSVINLTPTANTVAATTISVRLNAAANGSYNDSIKLTTAGGITKYIKLLGTTSVILPSNFQTLIHWPFNLNNGDSTAVRTSGVLATIPAFTGFFVSNGTTVSAIPAYSPQFGQAFGANPNGDGNWASTVGGPGGTLRRTYHEQFNVTAATGYAVKVDSIYITSAFYNTSSNTRMAVVYSLSNFVSDSSDVFTIPGGFANPVTLLNQTAGPSMQSALSVAGLTGITLQPGQTISFRLYFSCGSTSAGRYAMVKDVKVVGSQTQIIVPSSIISVTGTLNAFTQTIGAASAIQTYTVSGTGLSQNITITPPANFEVSANGTNWFNNTSPLILTQTGGQVAVTTISVRLNAAATGNSGGNITHASTNATTLNLAVTGNTIPAPSLTVTGTLNAFSHTVGSPSTVQTYTVNGNNLTGTITVTPPIGFELSNDGGTSWKTNSTPLVLTPASGSVPATTISVRMNAASAGAASGNITHVSSNATTINLAVTGNASPAPAISFTGTLNSFTQILGQVGAAQTITVSGANLSDNIAISIPAGYEISINNGTSWSAGPVSLQRSGNAVPNTVLSLRLNASAVGNYNGNLTLTSVGATTRTIALTGATVPKPLITVTQTLGIFSQTIGASPMIQQYVVQGTALTGGITITPPPHFQISVNSASAWQSTAVVLTASNGVVPPITIYVRMNVPVTGMFSGTITHTSPDANAVNVLLNGQTKVAGEYVIYPVPASRIAYIAHPVVSGSAKITIYNMAGQYLTSYNTQPNTIETAIDVSGLPQGVYLVEYRLNDHKELMRLVKN